MVEWTKYIYNSTEFNSISMLILIFDIPKPFALNNKNSAYI